jgi:hypothetical protein
MEMCTWGIRDNRSARHRLGRLGLATASLVATSSLLALTASPASASKHKSTTKHATSKTPCLVGNWTVTNFTLNSAGSTATGGAGTLVDISANRKVIGKFSPGAVLKTANGEAFKFSGTDYGSYGFNTKSTAKSGTFAVTYTSASNLAISVNGSPPAPTGHSATSGSYLCKGKGLTLTFPAGGNEITYVLVPSK